MTANISDIDGVRADRQAMAARALADGQIIVGLIGAVIPVEVIRAAGAFPLVLSASAGDKDGDCAPMELGHEAEVRSLFRQAMTGAFDVCDIVFVASTTDGYRYLFQYLREMVRTGQADHLPPIVLYDFLFGPSAPVKRYSRKVLEGFAERLGALTGYPVTNAGLKVEIDVSNAVRQAMQAIASARRSGKLSGPDAHTLLSAQAYLEPQAYIARVDKACARSGLTRLWDAPKVLVASSVPLYHDRLHGAIEAAGLNVVAEDDEWGARRITPEIEVSSDPLDAILEHYCRYAASPRQLQTSRERWLIEQFKTGMDAVIFYIAAEDQSYGWRYPALAETARETGLPSLLLRDDVLTGEGYAAAMTATRAFAGTLSKTGIVA